MVKIKVILGGLFIASVLNAQNMKYPVSDKGKVIDEYFGEKIQAPYRWLEDDQSKATADWVQKQNKLTFDYLKKIPYRNQLKEQITRLWNYEKVSAPFEEGEYTYYYKNNGLQPQAVLYRKLTTGGPEETFLDPNNFSKDGTSSLGDISFSKDGNLAAYQISEGGSDWRKVVILDTRSNKQIEDTLKDVKFSGIAWKGSEGFYYSSYDKPKEGSQLAGKTEHHKLYYHTLGEPQSKDKLVFGGESTPRRYIMASVTEDQRYLVITAANSTSGNELYIQDFHSADNNIHKIISGFDNNYEVITSKGDWLYVQTNLNAPNQVLKKFNASKMGSSNLIWADVIPETSSVMNVTSAGGYLFASYITDVHSVVRQYDFNGNLVRMVDLPGEGQTYGFVGKTNQKNIYYSFTNYIYPSSIFQVNVETGKSELYKKPDIKFNPDEYISKQIFYTSKDGTQVPMTITYKKGITLDGTNPTILYGYGGFNISLLPSFSVANAVWLQNGGIYAVANLRGGGEYGREWHDAGTKMKKKNVFEDFIAAGEYLINNHYTSSRYLSIAGGSNGGLLVGAVMTMRPDLAKVALPAVGVLDMLRYHTFTAGAGWAYDYGTANDSKEMFEYLKSYSPVHNVKKGVCYPATLITTGDHDDRVVPSHSYKFAAELQEKQGCSNPALIRIETKAGHGAGKPTELIIEESADKFAFILYNFGIKNLE
ncbi:prolyl oligopeptidase family serine peptidase [Apibacter raozihei]|uniref:prolyl oligopeptidase family serine peptidase n=1 Tax=Apibacter raozihei TaxID=2500547 RepID=UPI001E5D212D|nr:prolyl oligopeptidase family serine peptidase [Apibacter raozihei]